MIKEGQELEILKVRNVMSESTAIQLRFPEPDLAMIVFADPKHGANVLSRAVIAELAEIIEQLKARTDLAGLIIASEKPRSFIAGADIRELQAKFTAPREELEQYCRMGRQLYQQLGQFPFPTVVAIDGLALGGGAELALWADFRIMADTPNTGIGFPEVKIGLIPGWGGIWTASRLAGFGNAIDLVCRGEPVEPARAKLLGLVDDVVPAADLIPAAIRLIRDPNVRERLQTARARRDGPLAMSSIEVSFISGIARAKIEESSQGHYPAPLLALDCLIASATEDLETACERAGREMSALVGSPVNRALVGLFFAREINKKDPGVPTEVAATLQPRPIQKIGVVGTGIMGYSIGAVNLKRGRQIVFTDNNDETLQSGSQKALDEAAFDKQTRGPDPQRVADYRQQLTIGRDIEAYQDCDLVVEAIVENLNVKRKVLKKIEAILPETAILGSNTSTIQIGQIASALARPENFCGLHFFNPVRRMPLVEIVRGPLTSDQTIVNAVAYAKQIGKTPIVVNDGPGFLVNRILSPYLNEAVSLLHEGVHWSEIDRAAVVFGMPIGPFGLYDLVGIDTSLYCGKVMLTDHPERIFMSPVLIDMFKADRMGVKNGRGFYQYTGDVETAKADPEADELFRGILPEQMQRDEGHGREPGNVSRDEIIRRLLLAMVLEATRVLQDKIVRQVQDVDLGVVLGLGFPAFRQGILPWADAFGIKNVYTQIEAYFQQHGERWRPTALLTEMAAQDRKFYNS
jgi:3-hydroxyacyl-CoA dehydrogenase/enoyl-CoA hydratase/carnithine racemase